MIEVLETHEVPDESESKFITKAKQFISVFNVDTSQWDRARTVKWILSKLVLAIIVLGFGIYTTKISMSLLLSYVQSEASYIPRSLFNNSIRLPPSVVCLPLSPFELDDYWADMTNALLPENVMRYQNLSMDYFNKETTTNETLLAEESEWPTFFLFIVHHYLYLIMQFEKLYRQQAVRNHYLYFKEEFEQLRGYQTVIQTNALNDSYNDLMAAIVILVNQTVLLNISTDELNSKYGATIKALFNLVIFKGEYSVLHTQTKVNNSFSSFEAGYNCFIAFFDRYDLRKGDIMYISAQRWNLSNPQPLNVNRLKMTVGIGGRLSYGLYNGYCESPFGSWKPTFPLQVASTYKSLPYVNGKLRCSEKVSFEECTNECQRVYIKEKCNCSPKFAQKMISRATEFEYNETGCNPKDYMVCFDEKNTLGNEDAENRLIHCEKNCPDICERTAYVIPRNSPYGSLIANEPYKETSLVLAIANFDYFIYEQKAKWTFASFIGALGGALGLFMGINILNTIAYATAGIKILLQKWKRKASGNRRVKSELNKKRNSRNEAYEPSYWKSKATVVRSTFEFFIKTLKQILPKQFSGIFLRILLGLLALIITLLALREYYKEQKKTNVNVKENESWALPSSTICLPLNFGEFGELVVADEEKLCVYLDEYFSKQNITKDYFLSNDTYWNNKLLSVVRAYLIKLETIEGSYKGIILTSSATVITSRSPAVNVLETHILKLNISYDELRQKFGRDVAQSYYFQVMLMDDDGGTWIKVDMTKRTNYIDNTQICYEIPFNLLPLKRASRIEIRLSEYRLPNPWNFGAERAPITIYFGKRYYINEGVSESLLNARFGESGLYMLELTKYRSLREERNGTKLCSELTFNECQLTCRIKTIQSDCGCSPNLWPSLLNYLNNTITDICNTTRYDSCLNRDINWEYICNDQCPRSCDRTIVTVKDDLYMYSNNGLTTIYLMPDNMYVASFDEQFAWSTKELLGIIGGIVSFILGFSFIEILSSVLSILLRLFEILLKKLKSMFSSQSATTEAMSSVPNGNIESSVDSDNTRRKFLLELKKIGWEVDKPLWLIQHVIELIVIVCFSWLTFDMCIQIIMDYSKSSTHSVMELALNEPLILKQDVTVRIQLDPMELEDTVQADSIEASIRQYEIAIDNFFNQPNVTKENFLGGITWTSALRYTTYIYISTLWYIETATENDRRDLTLPSSVESSVPHVIEKWSINYFLAKIMETKMNTLNISVNELRQKLGREVAAQFSLSVRQTINCEGHAICQNETEIPIAEVTVVDKDYICFQLPLHRYEFWHPKQSLILTANGTSLAKHLIPPGNRLLLIYLSGNNDSYFNDQIAVNKYQASTLFNQEMQYSVSVSKVFQSMTSLGKCNIDMTYEICFAECRIALFRDMCNCTPASWSSWSSLEMYEECRLNTYISCVNYSGIDDDVCVKERCFLNDGLCTRWDFNIQQNAIKYSPTGARIVLRIAALDYPIFVEQYEESLEEFTGALGGAIGFYLPLDFLVILLAVGKIMVFLGKQFLLLLKKMNKAWPLLTKMKAAGATIVAFCNTAKKYIKIIGLFITALCKAGERYFKISVTLIIALYHVSKKSVVKLIDHFKGTNNNSALL